MRNLKSIAKPFSRVVFAFTLGGLLASTQAVILPVAEDTSSTVTGKINQTTGKATTLSVTSKQQAFLIFDLSGLPASVTASNITSARLNLYVASVATAGDLTVHVVTNEWQENTVSLVQPGYSSSAVGTIPAVDVIAKNFIVVDVTAAVSNWFANGNNFGFAIATVSGNVRLASKEGLGTGFPAILEIETAANGTVPLNSLPGAVVTNNGSGVTLSGAFTGDGSGLTNLNASQLSSGTLPLAQLPAVVVTNNKSNVNLFGTFSGNGSGLTNLNGAILTGISGSSIAGGLPVYVNSSGQLGSQTQRATGASVGLGGMAMSQVTTFGPFASFSNLPTPVPGLTTTLVTSGRPVMVFLMGASTNQSTASDIRFDHSSGSGVYGNVIFLRAANGGQANQVSAQLLGTAGPSSGGYSFRVFPGACLFIDLPPQGTNTYSVSLWDNTGSADSAELDYVQLVAVEF